MQKITLGLSLHRPEMIPFLANWMQRHDAVVLEEPPADGFEQMLIFIADAAMKTLGKKGHLFGPGDQLTLLYIFHSTVTQPKREAVLAARSLIYSKLIAKEEVSDNLGALPHLRDELACIQISRRLSTADCRKLFPLVRSATGADARQIVAEYLAK